MGYITELKSKTKGTRYRAVINIRKKSDGIEYFATETFSTKALAKAWLKKEEDKLEKNPHLLSTNNKLASGAMSLASAITRYKEEITDYGRTKAFTLEMLKKYDISQKSLSELKRTDYADHALRRRDGYKNDNYELDPVEPSTILFEFQCMKSVLDHAELLWGIEIDFNEYEKAVKGLRKSRVISESEERTRLPTAKELQDLTTYAYIDFHLKKYSTTPIHLIMWLDIYTGRRLGEIVRLKVKNYDRDHGKWFIEGVKHPNGSKGNDKWFVVSVEAAEIIEELLKPEIRKKMLSRGGDEQYLIPVHDNIIDRNWQKIKKLAGINDLRFHDLRHEAATRLAEQGLTVPQIQQYTLHDDWNSLKRYVNLDIIRKNLLTFKQAIEVAKTTGVAEAIKKASI
ncbi:tyrosine-type recombinase/integrase [Acinetobacter guerrae]|uniref:tyrosine-type recombinase/integrase n=1 Tax=Acinetobacter guerrae TaxID=1843371 RepID=UPI00128DBC78|nr:tyrosine-type recombinase/integrase [Acinetobacter guerrae]MPW45335.1 integrase [Acinetobacter guerrae]